MKRKRWVCLGCFKIRETNDICCEKSYQDPYTMVGYYGDGKTGENYLINKYEKGERNRKAYRCQECSSTDPNFHMDGCSGQNVY